MNRNQLLRFVRCPESRQELEFAGDHLIERLNSQIAVGTLLNKAGLVVETVLSGGLVRKDGKILYPIVNDIPNLIPDEGIPLD